MKLAVKSQQTHAELLPGERRFPFARLAPACVNTTLVSEASIM